MNNLEQKYVDEVNAYLALPVAEREIEKGAMLMLKGNRNQTLHKNVIRKSWHERVEYELKKIIGERFIAAQQNATNDVTTSPFKTVSVAEAEMLISNHLNKANEIEIKGKRTDHELLPEAIQLIPEANKVRYQRMRSLHEKLKLMNDESFTAEDRKPIIEEFTKLDGDLRLFWEKYDTYVIGSDENANNKPLVIDVKRIQSNRTFFSRVVKKEKLTDEVLTETQARYNEMQSNKVAISPEITEKLKAFGVKVISADNQEVNTEKVEQVNAPAAAPENTDANTDKVEQVNAPEAAPENTDANTDKEVQVNAPAAAPENADANTEDNSNLAQINAESILKSSIKGMLKSNVEIDVIKSAFSSVPKVGEKDLTPELLEELIEASTAELIDEDQA